MSELNLDRLYILKNKSKLLSNKSNFLNLTLRNVRFTCEWAIGNDQLLYIFPDLDKIWVDTRFKLHKKAHRKWFCWTLKVFWWIGKPLIFWYIDFPDLTCFVLHNLWSKSSDRFHFKFYTKFECQSIGALSLRSK